MCPPPLLLPSPPPPLHHTTPPPPPTPPLPPPHMHSRPAHAFSCASVPHDLNHAQPHTNSCHQAQHGTCSDCATCQTQDGHGQLETCMAGMREQSTDQTPGQDRQPACARLAPCGAPSISDTASTCTTISNISLRTRNARIRTSTTCSRDPRPRRRRRVPLHQLLLGHFTLGLIPTSSQFHTSLQSSRPAMARRRGMVHQKPRLCLEKKVRSKTFLKTKEEDPKKNQALLQKVVPSRSLSQNL